MTINFSGKFSNNILVFFLEEGKVQIPFKFELKDDNHENKEAFRKEYKKAEEDIIKALEFNKKYETRSM